jgi:hypothetical protein
MNYVVAFLVVFVVTAAVWIAAATIYNLLIGGFNFGELSAFARKSALLVALASAVLFVPFGGWLALAIWWIGVVALFGMDFWEAKIIVVLLLRDPDCAHGLAVTLKLPRVCASSTPNT